MPARYRLCGYCGTELQPDLPREIRRPVTVLFSDLQGSTTLGERLDSEALFEVLSRYFDAMRERIEGHGGTIEKLIGDAILAVFGMPRGHDDDPLRAVRAAGECQVALTLLDDELERTYGVRLTNRTGIATGDVVVGLPGPGEHVLTGTVLAQAMELEAAAPAMGVLLAESTRRAAGRAVRVRPRVLPPSLEGEADGAGLGTRAWELVRIEPEAAGEESAARVATAEPSRGIDSRDGGVGVAVLCSNCGDDNPPAFDTCGTCGSLLRDEERASESRRTVTIVFADLRPTQAGGGTPSPDRLRELVSRGFASARAAVERHGGSVEKFVGDALVAVFGLPVVHEDDGLRAARAALEILAAVGAIDRELRADGVRLSVRIGVNTGVVVAGQATYGLHLVTGDAVNTAARLEQSAPDGGVLLGGSTYALVRDAVEVEAVELLTVKGKAEPIEAHRLIAVRGHEGRSRRISAPLVGRAAELEALVAWFREAVAEREPRQLTLVGDAGIGKSRLVRELERRLGGEATVFRGRCLAYGESITFAPIVEVVRAAAGIRDEDSPAAARARIDALVADGRVADRLAAIAGLTDTPFPLVELYWGVRRLVETLAAGHPLVIVVDAVQWAEPALLDLLEHLLATVSGLPVMFVCLARDELLEMHPEWGLGERGRRLHLPPLEPDDGRLVVDDLLGAGHRATTLRDRIVDGSHGNPLFMEQLVSMLVDRGALRLEDGRWVESGDTTDLAIPPTIQTLLAARVDALPRDERDIAQPAAVVGYEFGRWAVDALVDERLRPRVPDGLGSLVVRQFVRPDPDQPAHEEAYRFRNQLVRDATYQGLLKRARVSLHERYVAWADAVNRERGRELEFEEVLGYHLEQAYRYRTEFGPADEAATAVGRDGARRLASAGRRSYLRGDMAGAAGLLGRAAGLLPGRDPERLALLPELGEALMEVGEFDRADALLREAIDLAGTVADVGLETSARLVQALLRRYQGGDAEGWSGKARVLAEAAVATFEPLGDAAGLTRAWRILFGVHGNACQYEAATAAAERVLTYARQAGDSRQEARGAVAFAQAALFGPTPVRDALVRCAELQGRVAGDRRTEALVLLAIAELEGMAGSFDRAREHYGAARTMLAELGKSVYAASTSQTSWRVEYLAGDLDAAEGHLRRDYEALDRMGERYLLSSLSVFLGRVLLAQDRVEEARAMAERARELADADDVEAQALWRSLLGQVEARRGAAASGAALAREAIELLRPTDAAVLRAEALVGLANVLEAVTAEARTADARAEARAALVEALARYETKGCTVAAEALRKRIEEAAAAATAPLDPP